MFGLDPMLVAVLLYVPVLILAVCFGARQDRRRLRAASRAEAEERRRWESLEAENQRLRDELARRGGPA